MRDRGEFWRMTHSRHSSLRAFLLVAIVAAGAGLHCRAAFDSGAQYWTIEDGTIPHIVYNTNRGINFAIDKYGASGWEVVVHHTRGWGYVAVGTVGETVNNSSVSNDLYTVEGSGAVFRVAFRWWLKLESGETLYHYGWVTLSTKDGCLVVIAGEVADAPDVAVVGRDDPSLGDDPGSGDAPGGNDEEGDLMFDWVIIDRGDYLELGGQNQPTNGTSGRVTIPSEIGGKPVCSIGEAAFYSHDEITDVVIPETVSNIGYKAFFYCESLKSCNIPSGVTNIDESAFMETALRRVSIPEGVKYIKPYAFAWCRSLTNAVWGAGVTNIGEMAFSNTALTNIVIPACVDSIGSAAFGNCQNLKSASVWPWTRLIGQPFDSSCWIEYTGTITNLSRMAQDCGGDVTNIMVWIGRENFDGVTDFKVYDDYQDETHSGSDWVSKILYYTGIAPAVSLKSGGTLEAKYTWPKIEVIAFDPATRRITGKVIPQGGCRIASIPEMAWQLGLRRYGRLDADGVNDWHYHPDVSGYTENETLGEFTHTISEEDFATNRFFRLELVDW